jgi:hypothetical protein
MASFRMSKNESELTGWFLRGRGPALSKIAAIHRDSPRFTAIQREFVRICANWDAMDASEGNHPGQP